jgi:uncharacterized repeat protein (TIGR04002 family)
MNNNTKLRSLTIAGLFGALIFLTTYFFHIPTAQGGYIHLGDTVIYFAASLMPTPFAAPAAAIGGALSDALSPGGYVWVIPTLIIKPLLTLLFTYKNSKIICKRNIVAIFLAGIVGVSLYDVAFGFISHSVISALLDLPMLVLQPIASGILFVILGSAFDRIKIKQRFNFTFDKKKDTSL